MLTWPTETKTEIRNKVPFEKNKIEGNSDYDTLKEKVMEKSNLKEGAESSFL